MLQEPKTSYDAFLTLGRGMDSGRSPSLIGQDQAAFLVNAQTRMGFVENRPGWFKRTLTGDDFQLGRWQGASAYISEQGAPFLVASIGGEIVRFDPIGNTVLNLSTVSGFTNPSNLPKAWFCQAEFFLLIQDNSSLPLVFDGAVLRRANPVAFGGTELPVGNAMAYNNGRLWVSLPDRRSFGGGDLAYSVTGDASDVLGWTQNTFLTGGSFALPTNAGFITSMRSLAIQDSVLGQGPLIVFGQFGAATINAPFAVEEWQTTDSPIASIGLISPGPTGAEACVNVNGDLWYRAPDGIRTYMVARRDHGTWVNTPVSREMERIQKYDDPYLLDAVSTVDFDNRLLTTCSPFRATYDGVEYGVAFRGLSVLDFAPVSSMFDRSQPSWQGSWSGLNILQILTLNCYGVERAFMFVLNDCQEIELWELSKANKWDNLDDPIEWIIETKSFGFADQSEGLKQFVRTETWLEQMAGTVTWDISMRPDRYFGWLHLDSGEVCATTGICASPGCSPPSGPQLQYRSRKISASPDDTCEDCNQKLLKNGFEFQVKLVVTGAASFRRFRTVASELPEEVANGCLENQEESCCLQSGCNDSPWSYSTPNGCDE